MSMRPAPIHGHPKGADEASPGSLAEAVNMLMSQPGVASRRRAYTAADSAGVWKLPNEKILGVGSEANGLAAVWLTTGGAYRIGSNTGYATLGSGERAKATTRYTRGENDVMEGVQLGGAAGILFPTRPVKATHFSGSGQYVWNAGAPRCKDIRLVSDTNVSSIGTVATGVGFAAGTVVAYRAVLSYDRIVPPSGTDDPIVVTGAPSGRFLYRVPTSAGGNLYVPNLHVRLPEDFDSYILTSATPTRFVAHLSVYRSVLTAAAATSAGTAASGAINAAPSDEMQLIFRTILTTTDVTNKYVTFTDVTPVGGEGGLLYTNESLGGVIAEKYLPPQANSVATHKGTTFYGGVTERTSRTVAQIIAPPPIFLGPVTVDATGLILTFQAGPAGAALPALSSGDTISLNGALSVDLTVTGTPSINGAGVMTVTVTAAQAPGVKASAVTFGKITATVGGTAYSIQPSFNIATTGSSGFFYVKPLVSGAIEAAMKSAVQDIAASICTGFHITSAANADYVLTVSNLATGALNTANLMFEARALTLAAPTLTVSCNGLATNPGDLASKILPCPSAGPTVYANRLWWGPAGIVDAVCPGNMLDIGSPDNEILKLVSTRDALYIFKEDGLWTLTGSGSGKATEWSLTLVSEDLIALTPSSISVYEDTVYAMCTVGVARISGGSVSIISGAISAEYKDSVEKAVVGGLYYTCIASHMESALFCSIPTTAATSGSYAPSTQMVYSFTTGEWTVVRGVYATPRYIADPNVGTQFAIPLLSRPAAHVSIRGRKTVVRFANANAVPYLAQHAYEMSHGTGGAPYTVVERSVNAGPTWSQLIQDDLQPVTLTYLGSSGSYSFVAPLIVPEADLTTATLIAANGDILPIGTATWSTTATPSIKITISITEVTPGMYNGQSADLLVPIPFSMTFAPFGDGVSAFNFAQVMLMQTARSSAKNLSFVFWLDTTSPFPFTAPDTQTVSPQETETIGRNVTRADVPERMTAGSRLNVKITGGTEALERVEFSTVLVDFERIAGEEVGY